MKNLKHLFIICAMFFLSIFTLTAQESPVKWTFKTVKINDSVAELQFHATIQQGYHFYAQSTKGIEMPASFSISVTSSRPISTLLIRWLIK